MQPGGLEPMRSYLTTGQKLKGFAFHQQTVIRVVAGAIGFVLFIMPTLSTLGVLTIPRLWNEEHGVTGTAAAMLAWGVPLLIAAAFWKPKR